MDTSPAPATEGDGAAEPPRPSNLTIIAEDGDLILDMTFENSKETVKTARRAHTRVATEASQTAPKTRLTLAFRVSLTVLKKQSKYFEKLLGDARFKEAQDVSSALSKLSLRNIRPGDADVQDLPRVKITDDDEATQFAHRDAAFADLLRVVHGQNPKAEKITMVYVTTLAVLADRFDCTAVLSKALSTSLKFKWPITNRKPLRDPLKDELPSMTRATEDILRQKILVAWLLHQPLKFEAATRELILNGSCQWSSFAPPEDEKKDAMWWNLQDDLEQELRFRRDCVLNTIASVHRHFLQLYMSKTRQCKLGYDSSAACDSYQLGEIFKFLSNKSLLYLVDFSPTSLDNIKETSLLQIDTILSTLKQCPSYQIDKHHTNCGLRTRVLPIIDFIAALLSAKSVPLSVASWRNNRQAASWIPEDAGESRDSTNTTPPFQFTRSIASDQRLRFENAMGADKFARDVFTAPSWDWTAEYHVASGGLPGSFGNIKYSLNR